MTIFKSVIEVGPPSKNNTHNFVIKNQTHNSVIVIKAFIYSSHIR